MRHKIRKNESGRTILVVDDQAEALLSTQTLLERHGHEVLTAASVDQALALLKEREVDLMLVDYFMPGGTGEDLVRRVRGFDPFVQIILQTGYSGDVPPQSMLAQLDIQGYHDKADGPDKLLLWVEVGLKAQRQMERARLHDRRVADSAAAPSTKVVVVAADSQPLADLSRLLADGGYEPLQAQTAAEALDVFVRERPFLILIDDSVLDASGADLIRRVRTIEPATAIIAQCGALDHRQRRRLMQQLGLHAVHDKLDAPARILEMLDSAVEATRRVARTGADQTLRGLILAKLCHDLRSYLHVVHGYTELLCTDPTTAERDILSRLAAASDSARDLVQQYLDLAHLESPGVVVRRELVSIDALLEDLEAQAERQIGNKPLQFTTLVPARGAVVHSDGEKLRAILNQLLTNAITFSAAGPIELAVCLAADHTTFVLTDTGPGMRVAELSDPTVLCSPATEVSRTGTPGQGLALAIALRLSRLLGGTLTADRGNAGGAVFSLSLPAAALTGSTGAPTLH
jgi:signal transduction histidine kinase